MKGHVIETDLAGPPRTAGHETASSRPSGASASHDDPRDHRASGSQRVWHFPRRAPERLRNESVATGVKKGRPSGYRWGADPPSWLTGEQSGVQWREMEPPGQCDTAAMNQRQCEPAACEPGAADVVGGGACSSAPTRHVSMTRAG